MGVHHSVLLDAGTAAIRGVFPAALDAAEGVGEAAVHGGARPVDLAGVVQALEQDLDESEPDAGLLPGLESAPAGHAAAAAHLDGEVLPRDAGLEDEEDADEGLAVAHGFAAGEAEAAGLGGRQQGLQDLPEFIGDQRLGQDSTSQGMQSHPPRKRCTRHTTCVIVLVPLIPSAGDCLATREAIIHPALVQAAYSFPAAGAGNGSVGSPKYIYFMAWKKMLGGYQSSFGFRCARSSLS